MKPTNGINKVIRVFKTTIKHCWGSCLVYAVILSLVTALSFAISIIYKYLVNELSVGVNMGTVTSVFIGLIILYLVLYFVNMASGFLTVFGQNFFRYKADECFLQLFMDKSNNTPQVRFLQSEFYDQYIFIGNNVHKISAYLSDIIQLCFSDIASTITTIVLFAIYEPLLIGYAIITAVVLFLSSSVISKKEFDLDKKQIKEQRFHDYYRNLLTSKQYAQEIRTYHIKNYIYNKWSNVYKTLRRERLSLALKKVFFGNIAELIRFLTYIIAIVILLIGIYHNRYDIGTFVLLFNLVTTCQNRIDVLTIRIAEGVYKNYNYVSVYYDYVMSTEALVSDSVSSVTCDVKCPNIADVNRLMYGAFESLTIENVSFSYPNSHHDALKNVSLTIHRGDIVSILGYNGSGKTTLSKIINGSFEPAEGVVYINNIPVDYTRREEIFKYFGIAPQDYSRYSLTIKDIVELGDIDAKGNTEELERVYTAAELTPFIDKYSKRDHTMIGKQYDDDGVEISGGEWQRLVIASAYFGNPEIILLDEPTASIDPLKEMEMIKTLKKHLNGKTAILISHRIGFARIADRIIMMNEGKIAEEGSHDELLQRKGFYSVLFEEQKKLYEENF